jgi:hypothetical protein
MGMDTPSIVHVLMIRSKTTFDSYCGMQADIKPNWQYISRRDAILLSLIECEEKRVCDECMKVLSAETSRRITG